MAALPAKSDITAIDVTQDKFKASLDQLIDYLTGLFGTTGVVDDTLVALGVQKAFPVGTRMFFQQTTAPTGWAKVTDSAYNDCAIRIVTGAVNGTPQGTDAFTSTFGTGKTTQGHSLSVAEMPTHGHSVTDSGHTHGYTDPGHNHAYNSTTAGAVYIRLALTGANINTQQTEHKTVGITINSAVTGISIANAGSGTAHLHDLSNFNLKYADTILASQG